jgi:hypothetical protein
VGKLFAGSEDKMLRERGETVTSMMKLLFKD